MRRLFLSFVKGILIGAGAILPGLSGASMAVVFGVYEDLSIFVSRPFSGLKPFLLKHPFLLAGAVTGFLLMSQALNAYFARHSTSVLLLFMGFIAGTIPGAWKRASTGGATRHGHAVFIAFCACTLSLALLYRGIGTPGASASNASLPTWSLAWPLSGAIVGAGSLLPGISASFFLVHLGWYDDLLGAISSLSVIPLALTGLGSALALVTLSRVTTALYRSRPSLTSFAVLGVTAGSLALAIPRDFSIDTLAPRLGIALLGLGLSLAIDRRAGA